MRRGLGVLFGVAMLSGCGTNTGPLQTPDAVDPELVALRVEQGLPDCPPTDAAVEAVDKGFPQTVLPCLGSDEVVNLADLTKGPAVVNFWAQWCGPCREEAPILRAASETHGDVAFIGINFDDPEPALALEFAGLAQWHYPHVRDAELQLKRLGVSGLPATFFVDADGRIVARHMGVITSDEQLADLMSEHLGVG